MIAGGKWRVYLGLLLLSQLWQWWWPRWPVDRSNRTVSVPRVNSDGPLESHPVVMSYRSLGTAAHGLNGGQQPSKPPTIVLLHGSPTSVSPFKWLIPQLAKTYRVIKPHLPGYGHSLAWIPDYGIRAYGLYVWALLDELGIERIHVFGH